MKQTYFDLVLDLASKNSKIGNICNKLLLNAAKVIHNSYCNLFIHMQITLLSLLMDINSLQNKLQQSKNT